jgi:hypothetical protein
MGSINVITLQGYYYLYALFFDYPLNNSFFAKEENQARVVESMRMVQRLHAMRQPYRKSWALRLFTERDAMARFSPELVNVVLYQIRQLVDQIGAPNGWSRGPLPPMRAPRERGPAGRRAQAPANSASLARTSATHAGAFISFHLTS